MALITSRYTMDKQDDTIRKHLAEHADLLGAIRLPNTAFKGNAGTEVTTDILFLRKRAPGAHPSGESWQHLETIDSPDGPIAVNEYFARHPEMMLGKMKLEGTMYRGAEPTLEGSLRRSCLTARSRHCLKARTSRRTEAGLRRRCSVPRLSPASRTAPMPSPRREARHPQRQFLRSRQRLRFRRRAHSRHDGGSGLP
jgi:hypothetical protein